MGAELDLRVNSELVQKVGLPFDCQCKRGPFGCWELEMTRGGTFPPVSWGHFSIAASPFAHWGA